MSVIIKNRLHPPADTKPSLNGRNVIVTGANTGLGFEAALKCVQLGADIVILAVRSTSRGEAARAAIEAQTGRSACVQVWPLDMLDYSSLKAFAVRVQHELDHLDYAILNAGVASIKWETTQYGYERIMQVNVLSTTLLALLLLPKLEASKTENFTPTLEVVGSMNHYIVTSLIPEAQKGSSSALEVYSRKEEFSSMRSYNTSKLFVMFAQTGIINALPSLSKARPDVNFVVVCPGACVSELARDFSAWYFSPFHGLLRLIQRTAEQGARTYVSGLTLGEKGHGRFWQSDNVKPPAALLTGEKNKPLQEKVWKDIIQALQKDFPEVDQLLSRK